MKHTKFKTNKLTTAAWIKQSRKRQDFNFFLWDGSDGVDHVAREVLQHGVANRGSLTVTQQVSYRPIKYQFRSWSHKGTKPNGSHHDYNPLLKPTGDQIATVLPSPSNREHRKRIGAKKMFLGTNYNFYFLDNLIYKLQYRKTLSGVLPIQQCCRHK